MRGPDAWRVRHHVGTFLLLLTPAPSVGHDFWIEPVALLSGETEVHFCVGEFPAGQSSALSSPRAERAEFIENAATRDLRPAPGDSRLVTVLAAEASGVVVYASRPSSIKLDAGRFEAYLAEEGLRHIVALRARRGAGTQPGRERFSRAAKLLIGAAQPLASTDLIGLRLEVLPEQDPRSLGAGDWLPLRLFWHGRPLADAAVRLMSRAEGRDGQLHAEERSDRDGRVMFRLAEPGLHLVHVVHMVALPPGAESDWESVWASLTFMVMAR